MRRLMEFLGNVVPFVDEMPPVHNTRGEVVKPDSNGPTSQMCIRDRHNIV